MNKRDAAVEELASIMAIDVKDSQSQNGAITVNLTTGESLILDNGAFNLFEINTSADSTNKELKLETDFGSGTKNDTTVRIVESDLGGGLGGLFRYRNEVLGAAMRDIGQLAVTFADAVNTQNKLGMDLDGQLGQNIFDIPTFRGLETEETSGDYQVVGQLVAGKAAELTDADYQIKVTAVAAGIPSEIEITFLNPDGTPQKDGSGNDIVYANYAVTSGFNELPGGIEVEFSGTSTYVVDDEFLIQPTKTTASFIELATNRPEDLAFAAPVRAQADATNLGSASVSGVSITNTEVSGGTDQSAFDGAGGIHDLASSPSGTFGAPAQIVFTAEDSYQVLDGETPPNVITNVTGATNLSNLLAQAESSGSAPAWPAAFSSLDDYPGYDISIDGVPKAGDSFTISYNTDGFNDNSNALEIANLQNENLVQVSSESTNQQRTFQDAYASMVGRIGEDAAIADISLASAEAMKTQSENWFESVSGVSLDEEAANLIKFQQSYSAAARILSTAQELFDTILSAAR